jgi:hypothetical protein
MPFVNRRIEIVAFERERVVRVPEAAGLLCPECFSRTEMLTTHQAAALMQVGTASVRRWLAGGKAHGLRTPGGRHRVCRASLLRTPPKAAAPEPRQGAAAAEVEVRRFAHREEEDV